MRTYVTELELDRDKYELNVFDMCEVFALEVQTGNGMPTHRYFSLHRVATFADLDSSQRSR